MPIEMYGKSRFMHLWVDILIMLHIFKFRTARLGEWRLNHIHSINEAEVINVSCSDSSAEIDYSTTTKKCLVTTVKFASHAGVWLLSTNIFVVFINVLCLYPV